MSQKKKNPATPNQPLRPTTSKVTVSAEPVVKAARQAVDKDKLVFGPDNFKWLLIGMGVMLLGYILMSGGAMPDPNTWDTSVIYSFRRITLAPFVILIGIGIEIYAIFYVGRKQTSGN